MSKWDSWKQDRNLVAKHLGLHHDIDNIKLAQWVLENNDIYKKINKVPHAKRIILAYADFLKSVNAGYR